MKRSGLYGLLLLLLASGCTTRIADLTLASSKNIPHRFEVLAEDVEGRDCASILMLLFIPIPLGSFQPSFEEAMDRAIGTVPGGNLMTNVAISNESFVIPLLFVNFARGCAVVQGDVGRLE